MRLNVAINSFCEAKMACGHSLETVKSYRNHLSRLAEYLGEIDADAISEAHMREWVTSLRMRRRDNTVATHCVRGDGLLSPHSINSYVRSARALFAWMEEEGITGTNAARRLRPTKEDLSEFKAATEQDIRALVADCSNHTRDDFRDRAIILFMRSTGCRVRGLVNLRLSDLDVADQSASVIEKGNKRRTVFMDSDTLRALHDWMEVRPATDQDWLFVALGRRFHGNKLTSSALRQMFRRRARNASISGHTNPHSLRQAYARRYLKNGGDVGILSSLMGHADVTTTMHYYGRLNQDELKEQYRRFAIDDTDRAANESMSDDKLD